MSFSLQLRPTSPIPASDAPATNAPAANIPATNAPAPAVEPQPSDAEVANTLGQIERATKSAYSPFSSSPGAVPASTGNRPVILFFAIAIPGLIAVSLFFAYVLHRAGVELSNRGAQIVVTNGSSWSATAGPVAREAVDPAAQSAAEALLGRVAAGDPAAASQVVAEADWWTGHTHRSARTEQFIDAALNSNNSDARAAAVTAQLALDGIPRSASGVAMLEQALGNPSQRAWALWMLGALGNRGVDPVHTAKIIGSYLDDPGVNTRANAVDGLSLIATDETVPMLLDRFRNDPSPIVQERAACDIAEAGMYTRAQRMAAAASLAGWVDDSLLSQQQRTWAAQALTDITGQSFGANSAAWKSWLARNSSSE